MYDRTSSSGWTQTLLALLTLLVASAGGTVTQAAATSTQTVFAHGGRAFFESSDVLEGDLGPRTTGKFGVRLWYNDLLRLRGALSLQGLRSVEGGMEVHPFNKREDTRPFDPYVYASFGRYFGGNTAEQAVIPAGVGVSYALTPWLNLNAEVEGRWALVRPRGGETSLVPAFSPSAGVSINMGEVISRFPTGGSDRPDQPPILAENEGEERAEEDEGAEAGGNERDGERVARAESPAGQEVPGAATETPGGDAAPGERANPVAQAAPGMPSSQGRSGGPARRAPGIDLSQVDTTEDVTSRNQMREVPAGTFVMGLTDEDPLDLQQAGRKRVSVTPFSINKFEVSNAEYRAFLQELSPSERGEMRPDSTIWEQARSRSTWGGYFRSEEFADYPVVGVTHEQASRYCELQGGRLPTEAEWEYAARGDLVGSIYPWRGYEPRNNQGRYLANYNPDRGGYAADGYAFTAPGDAYPPSSWGLYHMSGNVAEWVQDSYRPSYSELSDFNPVYENPEEERRVVRGGSWSSNAFYIGVGVRDSQPASAASPYIGFRCAGDTGGQ